ncbi:MAG TPA: iron ABC transporter permease [Candidatus Binataceae bacterium]|nr:iron ABC transporter permease [Candidatus Binataceae bacterium]
MNRVAPRFESATTGVAAPPVEAVQFRAHLTRTRMVAALGGLSAVTVIIAGIAITCGSMHIDLARALTDAASPDRAILVGVRVPRVLIGLIVGGILAAVGVALQALVRNPLAEGGILGISGGGALGAVAATVLFAHVAAIDLVVPVAAFAASLAATAAVYRLAQVEGRLEPFTLLLVGVIFNSIWAAAIMLVNSVVNFFFTHSIIFWLMGSFEAPTYREVGLVAIVGVAGFTVLLGQAHEMNLLSLGDDDAHELGVDVTFVRRLIFVTTSIMIGAAVSVSGIITFVGLIVPHVLRSLLGPDHRLLLPASILGGAAFTAAADLIARVVIAPAELPVGAITALCGGPFFIWVLRRHGRRALAL